MIVARLTTCFKLLSQACIESIRVAFYTSLTETAQIQKIVNYMREHCNVDGDVLYTVAGQQVCEACFRMVYGLRYNRFIMIKKKFSKGVVYVEHGMLGKGRQSDSTMRAISWLRMFVKKVGDHMPMKQDIHLPSCLTKADVYSLASDDLCQGGLQCCGTSIFYKIWQREFPHVKIPKVCIYTIIQCVGKPVLPCSIVYTKINDSAPIIIIHT